MFSCICNEIIKDTDHIVIKHWFKVFSQLTKFINSILRCIKYKNTVVEFFDEIILQNFGRGQNREIYYVAKTVDDAVEYLKHYKPDAVPVSKEDIYVK